MNMDLVKAIIEQRVLLIDYDGQSRSIEPHAYGVTFDGKELLRAYQTSIRGEMQGWRLFELSRGYNLHFTYQKFAVARLGFEPGDKAMQNIYAEVKSQPRVGSRVRA
jgi:hypothetical protein